MPTTMSDRRWKMALRCLVVEKKLSLPAESEISQIVVADTLHALGDMAAFRRRALAEQCQQVVIGLTGSCGKTTVKEMVFSILYQNVAGRT